MTSLKRLISQMNERLDELIATAKELRDASQRAVSEEELIPLQKRQETLLTELETIDQQLQTYAASDIESTIHEQFHAKLEEFQNINQEFVNALKSSYGLIQFDLHKLKEEPLDEEFFAALQRLHKMSLAPRRSQAIKSKKNKKSG